MKSLNLIILLLFLIFSFTGCFQKSKFDSDSLKPNSKVNDTKFLDAPYVLLISIDGFRHDYIEKFSPPNLKKFSEEGVRAQSLVPSYPSKTFTNHYSIVTGMSAGSHGIVANGFYDPSRKDFYRLRDRSKVEDGTWYQGVPLWVLAEKQGMVSACYFWVGSEANILKTYPSHYFKYNSKVSHKERISQVVNWLELPPEKRPHFLTLYFSNVDSKGHHYGVDSEKTKNAVLTLDKELGELFQKIKKTQLPVNIFIVSDHGMIELDKKKKTYLSDYVDLKDWIVQTHSTGAFLYAPNKNSIASVYKKLKNAKAPFKVYLSENTPKSWGTKNNPRFGDLLIEMQKPYTIHKSRLKSGSPHSSHGYDPSTVKEMHGIFLAQGPLLKSQLQIESFQNTHIYPLIARMLGLKVEHKIDGRLETLEKILISKP